MRIAELERRSGASRHTLRYYERLGLIAAQRDSNNNYRDYAARTVADLAFIQQAQGMGFSLLEIGEIFRGQREQQLDCAQGVLLVTKKLDEIAQKIVALQEMQRFLQGEKLRLQASAAEQARAAQLQLAPTPSSHPGGRQPQSKD